MTMAVCIQCGARKFGALVPCPECDFVPDQMLDRAKSVLLSDHHLDEQELELAAERIRNNESIYYSEQDLAQYVALFEKELVEAKQQNRPLSPSWRLIGYAAVILVPLAFFAMIPIGNRIGEGIVGRQGELPVKSGTIRKLILKDADGTHYHARKAVLHDQYLGILSDDGSTTWLPREQVISVEFER